MAEEREREVSDQTLATWFAWQRQAEEGSPGAAAMLASLERLMFMEATGTAI